MKTLQGHLRRLEQGFTLIEVLISMMITVTVMGGVFGLLQRGQQASSAKTRLQS